MYAGVTVAQEVHNMMMGFIFRAPINLFFDVTTIGKILNRFSRDLDVMDFGIFFAFGGIIVLIWQSITCLFVAAFAAPYILVVIAVFVVFSIWLFNYSMEAYTESYRVDAVISSPILSHF